MTNTMFFFLLNQHKSKALQHINMISKPVSFFLIKVMIFLFFHITTMGI